MNPRKTDNSMPFSFKGGINVYYLWFLALQTGSYFLAGWLAGKFSLGWWSPHSAYDEKIPLLPFMILPYLLYFPVMAAPLFAPAGRRGARRLLLCLISASAISYGASFTADAALSPRVSLDGREGVFASLIGVLYKYDTSPLHCPSLHSLHSLLIGLSMWKRGGLWRAALPCSVLITVSTVFVKQHFLWDAIAAALLAPAIYAAFSLSRRGGSRRRFCFPPVLRKLLGARAAAILRRLRGPA